ncbi:aldose epimerase [Vagococcus vulneris]|uniref:Aldose epimerase n=1 Tax=Vagococcus vulneris TaxID=1977869 RepID=A0A430A2N0_9ENTE|nr:aldose epimerase [Vagococcus vulneris]
MLLKNEFCQAEFKVDGAELISFKMKKTDIEYIWQGDPRFWRRHAPVLFPIVGRLKNDSYTFNEKEYQLEQHGFARDMTFEVIEKTASSVVFVLQSNKTTLSKYPFSFELMIRYQLNETMLSVEYQVNSLDNEIFFGIGGHPAFNVPLVSGTTFEDYYLDFYPSKSRTVLPLKDSFINLDRATLAQTNTNIVVTRDLFKNDAIILRTIEENQFSIKSDLTHHGVKLVTHNAPFVGFWSPYEKDAPFLCIEPWWGIADTLDANGYLTDKFGINHLPPDELFTARYDIEIF